MRYFNILLFTLIPTLLFGINDPHISISKVTPKGGVAYSQVNSIIEDNLGSIWFSTNNGLFSYNSINIKRYSSLQKDSTTISTNRINNLYKDNFGKIWVATENGLCSYNSKKNNFKRYKIRDQFNNLIGKDIISVFQDSNNTYWFSDEKGIGTINTKTSTAFYKNINNKINRITYATISSNQTIWVFYDDGDIFYLPKGSTIFQFFKKGQPDSVSSVYIDDNILWIGYQSKGLVCIKKNVGSVANKFNTNSPLHSRLPSNRIRSVIKGENNQIWVATDNGIAIIENETIKHIINKQKYSELPHHSTWSLYKDSNNNIWIGTWLGGLAFHSKHNNSFHHYTQSTSRKSLSSNIISCFAQVPNKLDVLVGTDDDDLNLYSPKTNLFSNFPVIYKGDTIKRIKSITYDKNGTLWVGTYKNGVLYQEKNKKKFKRLIPPFPTGFQSFNMLSTDDGLWVGNYPLGVYFYHFESKKFTQHKYNPLDITSISNNNVRDIIEDKNKNIWFSTENGLNFLKKGTSKFIRTFHQSHNSNSISSNYIYSIHEDNNGFLWLGTNGQGLDKFNPITGVTEHFTIKSGILGNEIFSILEDQYENLWLTTENGLCKFCPKSKLTTSFVSNKGIKNNHFYPIAALKSNNEELYFGGSNGLIRFHPNAINTNPISPITTITQLFIHNEEILPETENGVLKDLISNTPFIKLNYKQNSISFNFKSSNYINPKKNKFKYRLLGFDNKWVNSDFNGKASFTKLSPGRYTFEVKASNNYGIWSEVPAKITINITPPLWLTWYACLFYSLLFLTFIYFYRKQISNKQKLKLAVKTSKIQRETEVKLHQMKLQFFTNISHEFRTPLTLIQGPVNRLLKAEIENQPPNKQLVLIKNNTDRLLRLINQFLDFRKIEHGQLKLKPINTDIVTFSKNVFNCFEEHGNHRSFDFVFKSEVISLKMDFDTDKLDKVLVNLLSNAFKYSSDNGSISLKIQSNKKTVFNSNWNNYILGNDIKDDFIEISISDSGYGISAEELPRIFERFISLEKNHNAGTGIGLSLSINYIIMHSGQLIVSSCQDKGSVFCIRIPQHQQNTFNKEDKSEEKNNISSFDFTSEPLTPLAIKSNNDDTIEHQDSLILIVEDNPELLDFLGDSLQDHFRIAKAKNGKKAYEQIHALNPNLIISDIMMPEMDGIELCSKIKSDIRTSHLPVILLTALDTIKDRITGIHSGADAYLAKPFDNDLLIVHINNLLNSRKALRESFGSSQETWGEQFEIHDLDKKLVLKATKVIEENITNSEFTVEEFAKSLHLSRTHLHRKLKSLTDQSATEFIRNIRLKQAIQLIKKGDTSINEIGYAVGFNSHNYFTKTFKKQYGVSPSQFIKDNFKSSEDLSE